MDTHVLIMTGGHRTTCGYMCVGSDRDLHENIWTQVCWQLQGLTGLYVDTGVLAMARAYRDATFVI